MDKGAINISFLNLAAQSPSLELNFAMSEKIHRESNNQEHLFFMCDRALTSCSVNILNKKSICSICTYKAQKGYKIFKKRNKKSRLIKVKRKDILENSKQSSVDKAIDKELLLGVHSTISS